MDGRRALEFDRLDRVMPEVDRLLLGHDTSGTWTLGQILDHLASAFHLTMEQGGPTVEPVDPERVRVFEVRRRRFFGLGRFPDGADIPHPSLDPPPDADERASAEALRSAIGRFEAFEGTFPIHPLLGPMSRGEWATFHRLHCAHHLGFARPIAADPSHGDSVGEYR